MIARNSFRNLAPSLVTGIGAAMSDQGNGNTWIRDLNGEATVFIGPSRADEKVVFVLVAGERRSMSPAEWDALPLWHGP